MRRLGLVTILLALVAPAPAVAIEIHAHRGGTLAWDGQTVTPVAPENSMTAFRRAHALDVDKIEMDAKLTADGVPVIMHDATLDRTTDCTGQVRAHTLLDLRPCKIDILGTSGNSVQIEHPSEPIPTLSHFLDWARGTGAGVNLEIKNVPTDPDFDATGSFARRVLAVLQESGIPRERVQVQTFWPLDLDIARTAGWKTSLLTLQQTNEPAIPFAALRGYDAVGPAWSPLGPLDVQAAHALGLELIPYTLNNANDIRAARDAEVDGIISDNPELVRQVLDE